MQLFVTINFVIFARRTKTNNSNANTNDNIHDTLFSYWCQSHIIRQINSRQNWQIAIKKKQTFIEESGFTDRNKPLNSKSLTDKNMVGNRHLCLLKFNAFHDKWQSWLACLVFKVKLLTQVSSCDIIPWYFGLVSFNRTCCKEQKHPIMCQTCHHQHPVGHKKPGPF